MIAAQPGTTVYFTELDGEDELHTTHPVVAWDDEGYALIAGQDGRLVRVCDQPGFRALDWEYELWSQPRVAAPTRIPAKTSTTAAASPFA